MNAISKFLLKFLAVAFLSAMSLFTIGMAGLIFIMSAEGIVLKLIGVCCLIFSCFFIGFFVNDICFSKKEG